MDFVRKEIGEIFCVPVFDGIPVFDEGSSFVVMVGYNSWFCWAVVRSKLNVHYWQTGRVYVAVGWTGS